MLSFSEEGGQRLPDWKYCLSFSRLFFIPFSVLVSVISALAQDFSHALRLVRIFYSRPLGGASY